MALAWIALIVFLLLALLGVFVSLIGLCGPFLVALGAAAYDLILWKQAIDLPTLALILFLALASELLTWTIWSWNAKKTRFTTGLHGSINNLVTFCLIPFFALLRIKEKPFDFGATILHVYFRWKKDKYNFARLTNEVKIAAIKAVLSSLVKLTITLVQIWIVVRAM